jgi:hypothetical protein
LWTGVGAKYANTTLAVLSSERRNLMSVFGKTLSVGMVAILMLIGVTTGAFGKGVGGGTGAGSSSAMTTKGLVKLRANIVCANCSLEEAQAVHPSMNDLYELTHDRGKVVIRVSSVNNSTSSEDEEVSGLWKDIGQPPQLTVRAEDSVFQKLVDEKNRTKEMEITGVLRTTRTLDITDITVLG